MIPPPCAERTNPAANGRGGKPGRAPSTPYDHLVTWRKDGVKVRHFSELRTDTPFDLILDARKMDKAVP